MANETKDTGNTITTGGGAYIGGSVTNGGGTFVGRDQVITHSPGTTTGQQGVTLEQFQSLLTEIRGLVSQAGLDERKARMLEGDLVTVEEEIRQAKPDKAIIVNKLESTTKLLKAAGELTDQGKRLVPLLMQGLEWVKGWLL